jgi:hypothetical protein
VSNSKKLNRALRIECLGATGIYNPTTQVIDLDITLRMRSEKSSPIHIYEPRRAILVFPVESSVEWVPPPSQLGPGAEDTPKISIGQNWTTVDFKVRDWAVMPRTNIQHQVRVSIRYQGAESESNLLEVQVDILPQK